MAARKASGPAKPRTASTEDLAKEFALTVIREHGLPEKIEADLLEAGVRPEVIDRIGGYFRWSPHQWYQKGDDAKKK